jgi:predicted RNase H-like nuclease
MKEFEDKVDSIVCALSAYYFDKCKNKCKVYGKKNGLIISPHPDLR